MNSIFYSTHLLRTGLTCIKFSRYSLHVKSRCSFRPLYSNSRNSTCLSTSSNRLLNNILSRRPEYKHFHHSHGCASSLISCRPNSTLISNTYRSDQRGGLPKGLYTGLEKSSVIQSKFFHTPFKRTQLVTSNNARGKEAQGIHENISALQMKKRPLRRKWSADEEGVAKPGFWSVVAYATAEEYNLEQLAVGLQEQDLYEVCSLESEKDGQSGVPDVVHARALYQVGSETRELFLFREGSLVLWNIPDLEVDNVLQFVRQYEHNSYDARLLAQESECMKYTYALPGKKSNLDSRLGNLVIEEMPNADLAKYTFSNAMALSVKLGIWEASLDRYVDSIEFVTEDLQQGTRIRMSRDEVLRKTGQLFALRHLINLSSDLLDTPDFYWDRDELEALYLQTCNYFSIARRTKVMNEKLNHCVELVELLSHHLNDRHHIRLEWMIIILIMVEVVFEILHYAHNWER